MQENEAIIRDLYACAEGNRRDFDEFVSHFAPDGYMRDIPAGLELRGKEISDYLEMVTTAFPDVHRELFSIYVAGQVVIVELAIRAKHSGDLPLPSGTIAATGKAIDVPSCDVFHIKDGKIASFHCYNASSVLLQQLGAD
ncbi:ester cyclase [Sphingomonas sp. DG1-23]|uniref:nuclear transport factor 2 family protein n=1 Tax=Sphingomonas sp. DG1-23 TaxID=3068316 RepID=UPI00273D8751|nr:ester cyclase [Sphingomonas sp. DG1-23]MDP5277562.1 ester cyclase [Sphingomonas sp. DG1-23]